MHNKDGVLTVAHLANWKAENERSLSHRALSTILSRTDVLTVGPRRQALTADQNVFNLEIKVPKAGIPDQMDSGRCWIFSTLSCLRIMAANEHNLPDFELSDAYVYFYDRLTKVRTFLYQMAATAHLSLDSRLVSELMSGGGIADGGDFDSAIALIVEFGVVPTHVYPESWSSDHTRSLDALLSSKLREYALAVRKTVLSGASSADIDRLVATQMKRVSHVAMVTLGIPPLPNEEFVWEYRDAHGIVQKVRHTPVSFAHQVLPLQEWGNAICLQADILSGPLEVYVSEWTSEGLERPPKYVTIDRTTMRDMAIEMLRNETPVWFAMDVEKDGSPRTDGVLDIALYDFAETLGWTFGMTIDEDVLTQNSSATHAMVIVGVHLDAKGRAVRWKVLNSWGERHGKKGYLVMTDDWFERWVYQIAAPRSFLPPAVVSAYDHAKPHRLAPWNPLA